MKKTKFYVFALMSCVVPAMAADDVTTREVHSQPSYLLSNKEVEIAVTKLGAHMAPVTFFRDTDKSIRPYHVSPWQDEKPSEMPAPVLVTLRGDFFCMPFGGNSDLVRGEKHPPHGEIVGENWTVGGSKKTGEVTTLSLGIDTKVRKGHVSRELSLVDGQNIVYSRTIIDGFAGQVPLGHHATLAMPEKEGAVRIATSAFRFGMTYPGTFSDPKNREYQSLLPGSKWTSLDKVPTLWKDSSDADLTKLPGRYGYADLVQIVNEPWEKTKGPAWIAATYQDSGYVWFALKDPSVLNSTVFWMENHGRHAHPWNGRNNCLGLEDVTAYFADGLAASTGENILSKQGIKTALDLSESKPTLIHYIQGVAKIPDGFENVQSIEFEAGKMTILSTTGKRVPVPVRHEFLRTGKL